MLVTLSIFKYQILKQCEFGFEQKL